jgi:DnaK suppressor protein
MWGVRNERLTDVPRQWRGVKLAPMMAMPPLDEGQLAQLRAALETRLAALSGVAEPQTAGGRDLPVPEIETSPADKATVRLLNDLALEAAGHNAAQMQVLRHALAKFDDGSYGLCEECGGDIGFSRLQARPEARLCITCQTRLEKR